MSQVASLAMPLLRLLDPEQAHRVALAALRLRLPLVTAEPVRSPRLEVRVLGLAFPNPLGLAAGFDKDAVALPGLARLGFGFLEAGTITPRPQPGNPRPRMFRLREDGAVINRMGFNNGGAAAAVARLSAARPAVPVGANVGVNKVGADPERDYPALVEALAPCVDYIVLNVSSPNTPGLRDLQAAARLSAILAAVRARVPAPPRLFVKIAPDLAAAAVADIVEACAAAAVDGLIVSNTTLARPTSLRSSHAREPGGLSGAPLMAPSTALLAEVARLARGRLTLIGTGGIGSGADILAKLRAGASLVQVYTAFAFEGPALVPRLLRELLAALDAAGLADVSAAIGRQP